MVAGSRLVTPAPPSLLPCRMSAKKLSPELDYPDLSKHNNHMAKHLTPEIYAKLRDVTTPNGFTLDECIQTGQPFRKEDDSSDLRFTPLDSTMVKFHQIVHYPMH